MGEAVALQGLDSGEDTVGVWRGLLWRGPGWKGLRGDRSHWANGEGDALKIAGEKYEFRDNVKMLAYTGHVWLTGSIFIKPARVENQS